MKPSAFRCSRKPAGTLAMTTDLQQKRCHDDQQRLGKTSDCLELVEDPGSRAQVPGGAAEGTGGN